MAVHTNEQHMHIHYIVNSVSHENGYKWQKGTPFLWGVFPNIKRGERIGSKPPYGYQKDPNDPKRIIPNEDTAPIVRHIFALCASGFGPSKIARILQEEQVVSPTVCDYRTYGTNSAALKLNKPYAWSHNSVSHILEHEEYIGTTVNCRSYIPSFKSKKSKDNPPDKWLRFENTHEPLIDRETWDIVQRVRQGKRRPNKIGEQDMLSGLVECETCGTKHYLCRCGSWNEEQYTYTCGKYHTHKDECTPHTIKVMALHQIVLVEIQRVTAEAKEHTEQFLRRAMDKLLQKAFEQLALVCWHVDILTNNLPEFPAASLSSIDVATATPHSSALQMDNSFCVISSSANVSAH